MARPAERRALRRDLRSATAGPERVRAVADGLGHLDTGHIAAEIRLELAHPTQPVAEIVGPMRAGEDDLREFLRLLADELERRATPR